MEILIYLFSALLSVSLVFFAVFLGRFFFSRKIEKILKNESAEKKLTELQSLFDKTKSKSLKNHVLLEITLLSLESGNTEKARSLFPFIKLSLLTDKEKYSYLSEKLKVEK